MSFLDNINVGTKILMICLGLAIVPTLLLGSVSWSSSSNAISDQIDMLLETQVNDMKGWTNDVYKLTRVKVNSDLNVLRKNFYMKGQPEIINGKMILINEDENFVVNDNFLIVDEVQSLVGGAATVFQVINNSYAVRISTNVIGNDGKRAVGTHLTDNVYDVVVRRGDTYYGKRDLFGKEYVTAYEPIKNAAGKIIGVLFVGTKESETLDVVKTSIGETQIGDNGYMYIFDGNGILLVHPKNVGESVLTNESIKEMIDKKEGTIKYNVDGKEVIDVYTYYEPLDWFIVSRAYVDDFNSSIISISNTIFAIVTGCIIIGTIVAIYFGRSISIPLNQVVMMIKELKHGHLSTRLNLKRKDEIGVMADTMDEFAIDLQNNIVYNFRKLAKGEYIEHISVPDDEDDEIRPLVNMMVDSLEHLNNETNKLINAAEIGDLSIRGDEKAFKGGYKQIIAGFNTTLQILTTQMHESMRLADFYAKGDFTARFDDSIKVEGEFKDYKKAINTIGIELSRLMKLITEEVFDGVNVLSSASSEILQVTNKLSIAIEDTANLSNETHVTMEDIQNKTKKTNQKAKNVSDLAINAITVSKNGQKSVEEILDGMHHIQRQMDIIEVNVLKLSEQSQTIGEIIATVTDISEQSNLLAVNASIEAAKAGEFGKGFAVVATEIHNLAQQSKQATSNIRMLLLDIQRGINNAASSTDNGINTVSDTLKLAKTARDSIEVLSVSINKSSASIFEITSSIEEQEMSVDQIMLAIECIKDTTRKNLETTRAAEMIAEDLHKLGIRLKKITEQYNV